MATAVGVMAANLYYAQPLVSMIAKALGLRPDAAGLVLTATQVGYGLGVLLIVPLGDLFENRKLILTMIGVTIVAELFLGLSDSVVPYFIASLLVGIGASAVQIIVPYVSHLSNPLQRGQVIGSLMSGLMLGIMLSRPLASLFADFISYHAVFFFSAFVMLLLMWRILSVVPERKPEDQGMNYGQLIWSMKSLIVNQPTLRRRALYQACMFGAFCLFWTVTPMLLVNSSFQFTQKGVAIFALAGVAGAIAAPFAGKFADKGWSRQGTMLAFASGLICFLMCYFLVPGSWVSLGVLLIAANLLDAGVSSHLVLGQRAIFSIDPKNQSRLNGLYIAGIYVGGAIGSALGAWAYAHGGWSLACTVGLCFPLLALILFFTEKVFSYSEA
jgi:predicted MFS family arabinose efflux permease